VTERWPFHHAQGLTEPSFLTVVAAATVLVPSSLPADLFAWDVAPVSDMSSGARAHAVTPVLSRLLRRWRIRSDVSDIDIQTDSSLLFSFFFLLF
jgi:hypothetical protein